MTFKKFFNTIFFIKSSNIRSKSDVFQSDKKLKEMPFKAVLGDLESKIVFVAQPVGDRI